MFKKIRVICPIQKHQRQSAQSAGDQLPKKQIRQCNRRDNPHQIRQ